MSKISFSNLDGGREGLWAPAKWLTVLRLLKKHEHSDPYDSDNPLYTDLEKALPNETWRSVTGDQVFRPLFRDYAHPWTRTDVAKFQGEVSITSLGQALLSGSVTYHNLLLDFFLNFQSGSTYPFHQLIQVITDFTEPKFTTDQVTQHFELTRDSEKRRLRLALTLLEYAQIIAKINGQAGEWVKIQLPESNEPSAEHQLEDMLEAFKVAAEESLLDLSKKLILTSSSSLASKRFLILTGLSGSGKTKLAQAFSQWITPITEARDPFTPGAEIASDRVIYWVKKANALAVEFWNKDQEEDAIKVTLPREMIEEWADYIHENNLERNTPVRELREAIKTPSKYSDQLHSFETHLKAAAFALVESRATQQSANCYEVVSVGADWTGNENVLGYPNGLDNTSYITKPALELIIHAQKHGNIPHFLILDEMNLSHVERYFADILSAIESGEKITLHGDKDREAASGIPCKIKLPENLFIIGTVNVDETTYMFSPKVLDRANVIEFSMDDKALDKFLNTPAKPDLDKLAGRGAGFGAAFVNESKKAAYVPEGIQIRYKDEMKAFFTALQSEGAEYGFRVAHEAARFMYFYQVLGGYDAAKDDWFDDAFDAVIVQKFLPKLHGSSNKLSPLLKSLWDLCLAKPSAEKEVQVGEGSADTPENQGEPKLPEISIEAAKTARYKKSANKIARMKKLLDSHGFASFAEA